MENEMKFKLVGVLKKVFTKHYHNGSTFNKLSISYINNEMEYIFQISIDDALAKKVNDSDVGKIITIKGDVNNYLSKSGYINHSYVGRDFELKENPEAIAW